jgi:hypothetical protein
VTTLGGSAGASGAEEGGGELRLVVRGLEGGFLQSLLGKRGGEGEDATSSVCLAPVAVCAHRRRGAEGVAQDGTPELAAFAAFGAALSAAVDVQRRAAAGPDAGAGWRERVLPEVFGEQSAGDARVRKYRAGEALARLGKAEALRYALVLEGCVMVKVKRWTLERIEAGNVFGAMGLLHESAWEVGEVYAGPLGVSLVSVSYHSLHALLRQMPPHVVSRCVLEREWVGG